MLNQGENIERVAVAVLSRQYMYSLLLNRMKKQNKEPKIQCMCVMAKDLADWEYILEENCDQFRRD